MKGVKSDGSKGKAVARLLEEHPEWFDCEIARQVQCSESYVTSLRRIHDAHLLHQSMQGMEDHRPAIVRAALDQVNTYRNRVANGREQLAAADFARWIQFSGIQDMADQLGEGFKLRQAVKDLLYETEPFLKTGKDLRKMAADPELADRLTRIEEQLAKLL